jgi:hypothetical protein
LNGSDGRTVADEEVTLGFHNQKREAAEEILPFLEGDIDNFAYIFAPESLSGQDESV